MYFTSLHYTSLHCTSLHFPSLHLNALHFTFLHFTWLYFNLLHWNSLDSISLYCTSLDCTWKQHRRLTRPVFGPTWLAALSARYWHFLLRPRSEQAPTNVFHLLFWCDKSVCGSLGLPWFNLKVDPDMVHGVKLRFILSWPSEFR